MHQIPVLVVVVDLLHLIVDYHRVLESVRIAPLFVRDKDHVDLQIIAHVSTPTFGEISASSMNSIGKLKVEIGPPLGIGSSMPMVHW
jgi:hypothetical protein